MEKPATLHAIEEPETPVEREVLCLTGIYPANPRFVGPPWPQQVDWREFARKIGKTGA